MNVRRLISRLREMYSHRFARPHRESPIAGFGDAHDFLATTTARDVRDVGPTPSVALGAFAVSSTVLRTGALSSVRKQILAASRTALFHTNAPLLTLVLDLSAHPRGGARRIALNALRSIARSLQAEAEAGARKVRTIGIVVAHPTERELVRERLQELASQPLAAMRDVILPARSLRKRRLGEFVRVSRA